jgi:hypothetical protein
MGAESDLLLMTLGMLGAFGIFFLVFWLFMYIRASKLAKIVYQESETTFRMVDTPISNDYFRIGEKTFSTKGVKPKSIKTRWGWMPLFRAKFDVPFALPFDENEEVEIQPEALTRIGEMATLDKILKPRKIGWQDMIIYIALGAMIGLILGIVIVATGLLPIGQSVPAGQTIPLPPTPTPTPSLVR